jgi:hypothetical protein
VFGGVEVIINQFVEYWCILIYTMIYIVVSLKCDNFITFFSTLYIQLPLFSMLFYCEFESLSRFLLGSWRSFFLTVMHILKIDFPSLNILQTCVAYNFFLAGLSGTVSVGFNDYFISQFQRLLIEAYKVICKYFKNDECFQRYFRDID